MSGFRDKKKRTEELTTGMTDKQLRLTAQEKKNRQSKMLYIALTAVLCIAFVVLLVYNTGLIQRSVTAVTIGDKTYTAPQVRFYYQPLQSVRQQHSQWLTIWAGHLQPLESRIMTKRRPGRTISGSRALASCRRPSPWPTRPGRRATRCPGRQRRHRGAQNLGDAVLCGAQSHQEHLLRLLRELHDREHLYGRGGKHVSSPRDYALPS
jgi:hypothetical protein